MAEMSHAPSADIQLFRDVFNASPIGIAVESLDGEPLFVNPAFCSLLGFSEQELRRKHCVDFSPREDAEKDWDFFQRLKVGEIDHYQLEKRYFRQDGSLVWGRLSISLLNGRESPLILAMVEDITDKRNAEEALRASEERLRLAAEIGKMYAYDWDVATDQVVRSPEYANLLGIADGTPLTRRQLTQRVHPDDRAGWNAAVEEATPDAPSQRITYRVLRPDSSEIWLEKNSRAFFDETGKIQRMIGMVADITDRKLAEEALAGISLKLIEAQEQERTRIARELHDDINQRLALLSVELEASRQSPPESAADTSLLLTEIRERIDEISSDLQSLSHRLHSSQLEYLGIVGATRSFCREFSASQNVEIDFRHDEIPTPVSREISLCLFRVMQEALHNAAKHSKARRLAVRLSSSENQLQLTVSDHGVGFDVELASANGGLGLTSMRERVRLVNGTIVVDSRPSLGTTIRVRVPFEPAQDLKKAV
jgi:PAS domain S-box-containing protein